MIKRARLGTEGSGEVYYATSDEALARKWALKLIRRNLEVESAESAIA